jgi:steroid 5-alpha reductase family enzyme
MFDLNAWLAALAVLLVAAGLTWIVSVAQRNVTIVDSLWSILFILAAFTYAATVDAPGPRTKLVQLLVTLWGLRLAIYLFLRNHGKEEDRRYQALRRRNEPGFAFKSLYLVFGFQAVLAAIISLPLLAAINSGRAPGWLDYAGVALWGAGLFFEAVGDWQLARFKADPASEGKVMDRGLWRYTRHPNYFGDFCVWWGFYLLALSAGGWWSIIGPALMSVLLLKYSGVALLERSIGGRRPEYEDYVRRTNTFFPGPPR